MIQEHDACELTGLFLKQFYSYARLSKRVRIKLSDFQRNRPPSLNFGRFLLIIRDIFLNCLNGLILSILIAFLRGYVQNMQPYSQHGQKSTNKFKLLLGPEGGRVEDSRPVFTRAEGAELRFRRCVLFFVIFVFVGVALKYASLIRMRPGHRSNINMAGGQSCCFEWLKDHKVGMFRS